MVQHVFMYILTLHVHFLSNLCYNQCYLAYFSIEYMCTLPKRDKLQLRMPLPFPPYPPSPSFPSWSGCTNLLMFVHSKTHQKLPRSVPEGAHMCVCVLPLFCVHNHSVGVHVTGHQCTTVHADFVADLKQSPEMCL